MIDVDRLKEALAVLDNPPNGDGKWESDLAVGAAIHIAIEAARLLVEGQPLRRCTIHGSTGTEGKAYCHWWYGDANAAPCRMIEGWWFPTGKDGP